MTEPLKFSVVLSGTFWDKRPQFSIWIDEHVVAQSELPDSKLHTFNFTRLLDPGQHKIRIRLENKTNSDTVIEHGNIVKDMLLNIEDIIVDDIGLGNLLWSAEYLLDKPQQYQNKTITHLDNCVNLGWNGSFVFSFNTPFTKWLLEKL